MLNYMAKTVRDSQLKDLEQPSQITQQVPLIYDTGKNQVIAKSTRYQHKIRTSEQQVNLRVKFITV